MAELNVGLDDGEQGNDYDLHPEVYQQEAEHRIHVGSKDTLDEIAKLCIDATELDEAKDRCNDQDWHIAGLFRNGSNNFSNGHSHTSLGQCVATESSDEAHECIEQIPGYNADQVCLEAESECRLADP